MKPIIVLILSIAVCFGTTHCNKKDNSRAKSKSDLPQHAQNHLQQCSEACKTYVQLVTLGGQTYFYLGFSGPACDVNPNYSQYLDITGEPVVITSDLYAQLSQNGVLVNEIYNCDDQ